MAIQNVGCQVGTDNLSLPDRCTGMYCDFAGFLDMRNVTSYAWSTICKVFRGNYDLCMKCLTAGAYDLSHIQREFLDPNYGLWVSFCSLPPSDVTYPADYFETLTTTKSVKTKLFNHDVSTILTTQTMILPKAESFNLTATEASATPNSATTTASLSRTGASTTATGPGRSALIGVVVGSMIAAFILFGVVAYLIRRRLKKRRADNGIWDKAQLHGDSLTAKPHRQAKKDPNSTIGEICELPVSPGTTELQQTPETRWHELDTTADQGEKGDRSQ
ncbi:hypothetical protein QC763_0054930 [Podospora pseudopauciseta]|uniref:Mid2 domain-containing protein n=1 Tax=Podospora pseudopauciseta TaxID=2093780 RepID=A0ABR0HGJ2_9PEZI|nr:hypothetical protein QC763_0054930 [Podospora pseudopauciseta]